MKITALSTNKGKVWIRWDAALEPGESIESNYDWRTWVETVEVDGECAGDVVRLEYDWRTWVEKVIE